MNFRSVIQKWEDGWEYLDTLAKLTPLKEKAKFYYALFSESGFDEKIIDDAKKNETMLYDLEAMGFKGLLGVKKRSRLLA